MLTGKKFIAAFGAFICTLPLLMAPSGGFPSRPTFQTVTATQTFTNNTLNAATRYVAVSPATIFSESDQVGADANWLIGANAKAYAVSTLDAVGAFQKLGLNIARGTSGAISNVDIGNATDNPAVTINGVSVTASTTTSSATVSGCTTVPGTTVRFTRIGNVVTGSIDGFFCTSNSTSFSLTNAVPAAMQPARSQTFAVLAINNSVGVLAHAQITSGNSGMSFFANSNVSGWTASGSKGVGVDTGGTPYNASFSYIAN